MRDEALVIHKIFAQAASDFSQKAALKIKKEGLWQKFTYRQIYEESRKAAGFLIKQEYKPGDFAALILENRPEWAIIYLGIMQAGLACVPINPDLSAKDLKNLIEDSSAKIIFCSLDIFSNKIKGSIDQVSVRVVPVEEEPFKDVSLDNISWPQVSPEDIASLIYTSGTTSKPKGVLLSHKNICSNFKSIEKLGLCLPTDNFLSILPLHHAYSFMVTLVVPLFLGAQATYAYSFKPQDLSQIIREGEVTVLVGVPQMFSMLHREIFARINKIPFLLRGLTLPLVKAKLRRKFSTLRFFACGGARLSPKITRDLSMLGFTLIEGYGLTEGSPVVTFNPLEKIKFGSVGKALPDVEVKINNPDASGAGEVIVKGSNVMEGYFKHPELTKEKIKDGWLYTADRGYLDKEGYLFLTGRGEDVIVLSSGKNIYPEELEEYFGKAVSIKELCIIPRQEESFGQLKDSLFAVIIPNLEFLKQKNEANIQARVRWDLENLSKGLPGYKHIMGFMLTNEPLPRTALKKIKRYQVRQKYLKDGLPQISLGETVFCEEDEAILKNPLAKKIIQYISSQLKKPVSLNSHLEIDLSIDSLTRVELGLGLEALLRVKIPDELLYSVSTLKELILKIEGLGELKPSGREERALLKKPWAEILREASSENALKKVRINFGSLDWLISCFFKSIFLFIFRAFWFLRIEGRENLPESGPYLICPNHASYLDGLFIFSSIPFKNSLSTYFLGYNFIFEQPWIRWANKMGRLVSIDTATHLTEAMQVVAYLSKNNKAVCIFPEGSRSIDEKVKEFKKGVGILVKELNLTVVPVYIKGSHYSWPRLSLLPRFYPIKISFGRAVSLKDLAKVDDEDNEKAADDYEIISRNLRKEVLKLIC